MLSFTNCKQTNADVWTCIFLESDMRESYSLISHTCKLAFENAVDVKKKDIPEISENIKIKRYLKKNVKINIDYVETRGWGVRVNTKKRSRFFEKKLVVNNNLWIESALIVKVCKEKIIIQYLREEILYIREVYLPQVYKDLLFL